MTVTSVRNITANPLDLDDGRTVAAYGDANEVDTRKPHNKALLDEGHLIRIDPPDKGDK